MAALLPRRAALMLAGAGAAGGATPVLATRVLAVPVLAGAIRWDAWEASGSPVQAAVQATLAPAPWRGRAPFCARPADGDAVSFAACDTQAAMDAELEYASRAGLSYWAYGWYGARDPMMNAWRLHRQSALAARVRWCLLLPFSRMGGQTAFAGSVPGYARFVGEPIYQALPDGRALLYLHIDQPAHLADWGGDWARVRAALDGLRRACPRPLYVVVLHDAPAEAARIMRATGADAISNYMGRVPAGRPAPYAALDRSVREYWAQMAATGAPMVPICMTGWDTRPRRQRPPFWIRAGAGGAASAPDMQAYVVPGTAGQIAAHVRAAMDFVRARPASCPARTLLIYSWDECDEGGSPLVPTRGGDGPDDAILRAVGQVLRAG